MLLLLKYACLKRHVPIFRNSYIEKLQHAENKLEQSVWIQEILITWTFRINFDETSYGNKKIIYFLKCAEKLINS